MISISTKYPKTRILKQPLTMAILIFFLTSALSIYTLNRNKPLFLFLAEEYVELGWNYYQFGNFYGEFPVKAVFRPPGYSLFCAGVFYISHRTPGKKISFTEMTQDIPLREKLFNNLERFQAIILGISTVFLFLILRQYLEQKKAFILSLIFGCNPYSVILTGLYHYDILHIFAVLIGIWSLTTAIENNKNKSKWLFFSGLLWGLSTLIRPLTLILPAFIFALFLLDKNSSLKISTKKTAIFTIGMLLVLAPWTARNYKLTNKFIPVNAQSGIALWAATAKVNKIEPSHYGWMNIWYPDGDAIYKRITGYTYKSNAQYAIFAIQMEDEFKQLFLNNIKSQPLVYLRNISNNLLLFTFNMNDILIKVYEAFQDKNVSTEEWTEWITPGNPQNFHSSFNQYSFYGFVLALTAMTISAIILALKKHSTQIIAIFITLSCICIAYSITYLDLMYYSIKLPFLFLLAGYFIASMESKRVSIPFSKVITISISSLSIYILSIWSVWLTICVLFS